MWCLLIYLWHFMTLLVFFQVLGFRCHVVFVPVQPGASRGHTHFGPSIVLTYHYLNNPFKLPYDDHAIFWTNRIYRVSNVFKAFAIAWNMKSLMHTFPRFSWFWVKNSSCSTQKLNDFSVNKNSQHRTQMKRVSLKGSKLFTSKNFPWIKWSVRMLDLMC